MRLSIIHKTGFLIRKIWFILFIGSTLLYPLYGTCLDKEIELHGVIEAADLVEPTWDTMANGQYQTYLNDLWEKDFPGRKFLIRLRNQSMYSLLNKSPNNNVVIGKDGYLFEPLYIYKELMVDGPVSEDSMSGLGDRLLQLNNLLEQKNKELYIFITPSKAHYYTSKIPARYTMLDRRSEFPADNISSFKKVMDERGILYFDSNDYIEETLQSADPWKAPLFYKSGIHWSHSWGYGAAGAFLSYMDRYSNFDLPEVTISEEKSGVPVPPDADLYNSLNLINEPDEEWYSAAMQISVPGKDRPNVFLRGGSFLGQSLGIWFSSGVFEKGVHLQNEFYFLDQSNKPYFLSARNAYHEMDLPALMGNADILVLEVNVSVIQGMSWGFIEELLAHPEYLDDPSTGTAPEYSPGGPLYFNQNDQSGLAYVLEGLSSPEPTHTWTDGNNVELCFKITDDAPVIQGSIQFASVFQEKQLVDILVNNKSVFYETVTEPGTISFEFANPPDHIIHLGINLPDAGLQGTGEVSSDARNLGLALISIIFEEKNNF